MVRPLANDIKFQYSKLENEQEFNIGRSNLSLFFLFLEMIETMRHIELMCEISTCLFCSVKINPIFWPFNIFILLVLMYRHVKIKMGVVPYFICG